MAMPNGMGSDSYLAYVYADDGKLPVRVERGQFRTAFVRVLVKGKPKRRPVRQVYVTVQANRLGVPVGRCQWVNESMIHLPTKTRTRGPAERRRDSKRKAEYLAAQNAGPLAQGSDRTTRMEVAAGTQVSTVVKCTECGTDVNAYGGQSVATCPACKSE